MWARVCGKSTASDGKYELIERETASKLRNRKYGSGRATETETETGGGCIGSKRINRYVYSSSVVSSQD